MFAHVWFRDKLPPHTQQIDTHCDWFCSSSLGDKCTSQFSCLDSVQLQYRSWRMSLAVFMTADDCKNKLLQLATNWHSLNSTFPWSHRAHLSSNFERWYFVFPRCWSHLPRKKNLKPGGKKTKNTGQMSNTKGKYDFRTPERWLLLVLRDAGTLVATETAQKFRGQIVGSWPKILNLQATTPTLQLYMVQIHVY